VRVTYLVGSLDVGGAERQLLRLANSLDPERFEPRIVTLYAGGPLEREVRPGIPVFPLMLKSLGESRRPGQRGWLLLGLRLLYRLYRHLRSERPDVLHAYMPSAYVMGALTGLVARIPVIVAGRRSLTSYHIYRTIRWRLLARVANRILAMQVCNSEAVRRYAIERERLRADRTVVIPNGIDLPDGRVLALEPSWEGLVTAATIGNLRAVKGHDTLLRAVRRVVDVQPGFKLVLFGDGPERAALEGLRRELALEEAVVMAGRRPEAAFFLPGFDFLLLASLEEGFPNAVMEAMACGIPPVATAVGGIPELVHDGVEGLLVPPSDPARLGTAILWMIEHPRERRRMGEAARARIERDFSVARMVTSTEELYESLLGRRAGAHAGAR
jgi:glycosyltransferase involved in cell wall biosynthesis